MTRAPKKVILMEKKNICYVKRKVLEFAKPNCVFSYLYYNVFSTFWGSRHPLELKKFGGTLTCQKMTIWGTLNSKALIKRQLITWYYFNIWWHPWHLLTASLCTVAPWLGITVLLESISISIVKFILKRRGSQGFVTTAIKSHACTDSYLLPPTGKKYT